MKNLWIAVLLVATLTACGTRAEEEPTTSPSPAPTSSESATDICTRVADAVSEQYALEPGTGSATSCELGSSDGASTFEVTLDEADEAGALAAVREDCRAWGAAVEGERCMTDPAGSEGPVRYASYLRTAGSVLTITADVSDEARRSLLPAELASIESALS